MRARPHTKLLSHVFYVLIVGGWQRTNNLVEFVCRTPNIRNVFMVRKTIYPHEVSNFPLPYSPMRALLSEEDDVRDQSMEEVPGSPSPGSPSLKFPPHKRHRTADEVILPATSCPFHSSSRSLLALAQPATLAYEVAVSSPLRPRPVELRPYKPTSVAPTLNYRSLA